MDNDKDLKQNYLREEILDQDYDAEEFIEFLTKIKGDDAADLDIWTLAELKIVKN